ncbi:MAG: uracil phosphoribosyltransferase [Alphaproteobacteria bacterium]
MKRYAEFRNLIEVDHPLIADRLTRLREETTSTASFRSILSHISLLLSYAVTSELKPATRKINTPLCEMEAPCLGEPMPSIIPILRAGLGFSDSLMQLMPEASVGHIGVMRNEETHRPEEYLVRLPKDKGQRYILTDPMLATGYSAAHAIDVLNKNNIEDERIIMMALVAAPEGVKVMLDSHPKVQIYTASLDSHLNENAYIVPGLGDAGDRLFGTV